MVEKKQVHGIRAVIIPNSYGIKLIYYRNRFIDVIISLAKFMRSLNTLCLKLFFKS